jgi:hypothetical protein
VDIAFANSCSSSSRNWSNVSSVARGVAPISNAPPGSVAWISRRITRSRRRNRLRVTAGPSARPSENATEVVVVEGSGHQVHQRAERRIRVPSCVRRRKASRPRIGPIKRKGGPGPWRGGSSGSSDRRGSTCGRGNRGAWLAGGCWAGMCASRSPPRPLWRACRASGRCLMQDVMQHVRGKAARATWQGYRARDGPRQLVAGALPQAARHVLARLPFVLRSCACCAATGLSTPVDKRVEFARRAFQVCDQRRRQGAPAAVGSSATEPGQGGR